MEEPSYKSYQYLHDYSIKIATFLKSQNTKHKIKELLLDFAYQLECEVNIRSNTMNYPIYFVNFQENFNCFLYECSKYKFSRTTTKIINRLLNHQHPQKM